VLDYQNGFGVSFAFCRSANFKRTCLNVPSPAIQVLEAAIFFNGLPDAFRRGARENGFRCLVGWEVAVWQSPNAMT
jgi:hypothetical protein